MDRKPPSELSNLDRHLLLATKGGGIVLAGKLFTYGSRLVTVLILARLLAAEQYGQYNLSLNMVEVLAAMSSFGLHMALVRFIPVFVGRNDPAGLWGTLRVCMGTTAGLSLLLAVGLYSNAGAVAGHLFHDARVAPLLRVISVFLPFYALNDSIAAATRGFKKMHYTTIAQFVCHPLVKLGLILALALTGLSCTTALVAAGVTEVVVTVILVFFLRKLLRPHATPESPRYETGTILRYSLPAYLSDLLSEFSGSIQVLFVGALSTATQAGVYALTAAVARLSQLFQRSIAMSAEPIVSEMFNRNSKKEFAGFYQTMTKWTLALNLPVFLILVLLPGPILKLFGETFAGGAAILWLFATERMFHVSTGMCGVVLNMSGRTDLKLANTVVQISVLTVLNYFLIPRWGAYGAALAVSVAGIAEHMLRLVEIGVLYRVLPYNAGFLRTIAAGVMATVAGLLVGRWLPPGQSVLNTATAALAILASYAGGTALMGLTREEHVILRRAKNRASALLARLPVSAAVR